MNRLSPRIEELRLPLPAPEIKGKLAKEGQIEMGKKNLSRSKQNHGRNSNG
jgi:hypothetical protein